MVPYRLEYAVGEAKDQKVLNRLFAEVMIYTIDLILLKDLCHIYVELFGAFQIVTERFLHDYAPPASPALQVRHADAVNRCPVVARLG